MVAQESREQEMKIVGHIFRTPGQTEAQNIHVVYHKPKQKALHKTAAIEM